jgi:hypothetical protein
MIKQTYLVTLIGLLMSTGSMLPANDDKQCICNVRPLTTSQKVIIGSIAVVGIVVGVAAAIAAGPYVATNLPSLENVKSKVNKGADYVVPKTIVGKVGLGLTAAQIARPYILQTTEEKLNGLLEEKVARTAKTREDFVGCLITNKIGSPRNTTGIPIACEEAALLYTLNSSIPELNKKTEAFKSGKCFCSEKI